MSLNRISLSLCLLSLLFSVSCDTCDPTSFTFERESAEVTVQGKNAIIELPINILPPMPIQMDLQEELEAQNATGARAVFLQDLELNITDTAQPEGDTDNFDFIDEITIFVESRREDSSLPREEIARLRDIPAGRQSIAFDVDDTLDLKPYAEEGVILTTRGSAEVPADDTSVQATAIFRVDVL